MFITVLDFIGTFAFAFFGAHKAISHRLNMFGVLTCASLVAFGGGTIRELLLHNTPFYFQDYRYLLIVLAGTILAFLVSTSHRPLRLLLSIMDAIGMATFAYIGAERAEQAGLGIAAMVVFAVLTASGGGILADIITHKTPDAFRQKYIVAPPALLGVAYFFLQDRIHQPEILYPLLATIFILQCSIIYGHMLARGAKKAKRRLRTAIYAAE